MEKNIYGTSAPHKRTLMTTEKIMQWILLALMPAGIYGVFRWGMDAVMVILSVCISAVGTDFLLKKLMKKRANAADLQILVTALVLSYSMPASLDWKLAVLAGVLCAVFVNLSLHFLKRNLVSPVILVRLILMLGFSEQMQAVIYDGVSGATPLTAVKAGESVDTLSLILGQTGGSIGETSAILLCLGAVLLIMLGLVDFRVCGMYLFSFSACMAVLGGHGLSSYYLTAQLAGGGFMLALWFIAPAYSHLPVTKGGRWLYGIELGILTAVFRLFGPGAENLCYAFLIADLSIPVLEKLTVPRPFGVEKGNL